MVERLASFILRILLLSLMLALPGFAAISSTYNVSACNECIRQNYSDAEALFMKASALIESGRYREALEYLNASILIDPENSSVWKEKALALNKLGRYSESLKNINMSLLLDSRCAEAWKIKGAALEALGLYSLSNAAYSKAYGDAPYARIGASEAPVQSAVAAEGYVVGQLGP